MLNSTEEQQFKDTILHEIAHAIVGPHHGHDEVWRGKAVEIGCTGNVTGYMNQDTSRAVQPSEQKAKLHISPLTKKCPICQATAIETSRANFGSKVYIKLQCGHLTSKENLTGESFDNWQSATGKIPFEYQKEGFRFIEKAQGRCLIADEPGLGKTVQALSFLKFHADISVPCLWICKTTLKIQALKETIDWCGLDYAPQIIDSSRFFPLPGMKLYIVSYDLIKNIKTEKLDQLGIKTIVFDEVQHIKNPDSKRTQEVRRLVNQVDFFIALSATPWKNRGSEYFPVLNILDPNKFPSYAFFKNKWVDVIYDNKTGKYKEGGIRNIPAFKEYTKDIVLRRLRRDVLPDLPAINRQIRYVELEDIYGETYEKAEEKVANIIKDLVLDGRNNTQQIAAELMKLKHITGLAKVDAQVEDAIEFLDDTEDWEKLTIFHHHIDVGDDLEIKLNAWLTSNGYEKALRLKGGSDSTTRNNIIEKFKTEVKCRVLIGSTLASGEGLNIQFCQNASMMERQWNPANEEQAELRFSRPITKNELPDYLKHIADASNVSIRIPYLICAGTVDEMLTHLIESKRVNFRRAMNVGDEELQYAESEMIKELGEAILRKRYGKKS
jgi:SWI/SNF-related matrix-associated actin-dependent regulator 1 of chromatin subfamily A